MVQKKTNNYLSIKTINYAACVFLFFLFKTLIGQVTLINSNDKVNKAISLYNHQFYSGTIFSFPGTEQRPALPDSFISREQHFNIHYTTQGKDSVAETDSNANFIPDRIEKIAQAFEKSYTVECEEMGYAIPPSMNNGIAHYDIYVLDLSNQYAVTIKEGADSTSFVQKNVRSYIIFDNDFVGHGFHIQGENAIKVIAAHEFFHAIQLGYVFRNTDSFFFELSAVWMEDQVFDDVDNYLYYLDYFFSAPDIPLNGVSFTIPNVFKHIYGSCVFGFYIAENFGKEAIYQIWQMMPKKSALEAMDQIFKSRGSSFENEFVKFCTWNFFTGERAIPNLYYKEASKYPEIKLQSNQTIEYYFEEDNKGYFLTSAYHVFHPQKQSIYKVRFETEFSDHWRLGILVWNNNRIKTYTVRSNETITLDPVVEGEKIVAIPCNINRFADPTKIYFKQEPENFLFTLEKKRNNLSAQVKSFQIHNVYPNPFSDYITFNIQKISTSNITLRIFNVQGQLVEKIKIGELTQDLNRINWFDSSSKYTFSSGVYLFQFSDGSFTETKKVILHK
jgi:hypothetical protein